MFLNLTRSLLLVVAVVFTTGCAAPADDEGDDETAADNTAASYPVRWRDYGISLGACLLAGRFVASNRRNAATLIELAAIPLS